MLSSSEQSFEAPSFGNSFAECVLAGLVSLHLDLSSSCSLPHAPLDWPKGNRVFTPREKKEGRRNIKHKK